MSKPFSIKMTALVRITRTHGKGSRIVEFNKFGDPVVNRVRSNINAGVQFECTNEEDFRRLVANGYAAPAEEVAL